MAVRTESLEYILSLCKRERALVAVVGKVTSNPQVLLDISVFFYSPNDSLSLRTRRTPRSLFRLICQCRSSLAKPRACTVSRPLRPCLYQAPMLGGPLSLSRTPCTES